ncbi:MAG: helical backbone metal receptor [Desulfovibrionaceae bacterium]|nr:helical backbone metal receptor [Desulfovibrionaceae bacterium]
MALSIVFRTWLQRHGTEAACCIMLAFLLRVGSVQAADIQRIVPLTPSLLELVSALGGGDRIVGRVQFADNPPAARSLPSVGSYVRLNLEKIAALHPDLCLALADGTPPNTVRRLRMLGIPVMVLHMDTPDQFLHAVEMLGKALGLDSGSRRLTDTLNRRLEKIQCRTEGFSRKPSAVFVVQRNPLLIAGPDSFPGRLLELAGTYSPFPPGRRYRAVSRERMQAFHPEIEVVSDPNASRHNPEIRRNAQGTWIISLHPDVISRPSPDCMSALEMLTDAVGSIVHHDDR